mgnify:CR=1 FL=1
MAVTNPRTARLRDDAIPAMSDLLVADGVPGPIGAAFATFGVEVREAKIGRASCRERVCVGV